MLRPKDSWVRFIVPVGLVIIWYWLGESGKLSAGLFPTITEVGNSFLNLFSDGVLWDHIGISFQRVLAGFAWASLLGVPLGIILGSAFSLRNLIGPTINFFRQIPPVAWIPVFILWFGIGENSKTAVIFYAAFFPILFNTSFGVEQIAKEYWEVARLMQLSTRKTISHLLIPGSAAAVVTGLRLGMGMSWRALVAAEMLAANSGLGYLIIQARFLVRLDEMFVGIFLIGFVGFGVDYLFLLMEKRLIPWNRLNKQEGSITYAQRPSSAKSSF